VTCIIARVPVARYHNNMPVHSIDRTEWALRERVKELTCLYGIARVTQPPGISMAEALQAIVELLPPAWQYPEIACARIVFDEQTYTTPGFRPGVHDQAADIMLSGKRRGLVEVVYTQEVPVSSEPPFLEEERSLINMVAREIAILIERCEAEEYKAKLEDQLRHADRLATIGQLAAGVAHEINEPLANILGFAQLARKAPELPNQVAGDLEKIVKNCLFAREIIHELLTFARQMTPEMTRVKLNQVVTGGLYFLESRCAKAGIEVVRKLDPELPEISADSSQLQQVIVNLVVNAVQAMPNGGKLTIETHNGGNYVSLIVRDTGGGMSEAVKKNLFTPFFTTKDVDQGTGLGLAVVHGIVSSHGGTIRVTSKVGQGTCFEIQLPVNAATDVYERKNGS
jgi:two-component system NtrC family sensor kinase